MRFASYLKIFEIYFVKEVKKKDIRRAGGLLLRYLVILIKGGNIFFLPNLLNFISRQAKFSDFV